MRKFFVFLLIVLLVTPCLAMAHPGRTDGDGGHTESSTGEYHYHHGYPAHDHYDMDGDGRKDCPYNFDDKTGYNSGSHSSYGNKNKPSSSTSTNKVTETPKAKTEEKLSALDIIGLIFAALVFLPGILVFLWSLIEPVVDWVSGLFKKK